MSDDSKTTREIAIPLAPDDQGRPHLLRIRGDDSGPKEASLGVLMPAKDGVPLPPGADLIHMKPREDSPAFDCETLYEAPAPQGSGGRKPMSVSHEQFAANWDRIFGKKDEDKPEDEPVLH